MGGAVILGEDRENLCRRVYPHERATLGEHGWVIESQGLPNLLHELVHALFLGHLADDHGFDYGLIPLDLDRPEHRRHLWEELTACMLSVELAAPFADNPSAFAAAWFAEQFEIQGVFHGLEHDLPGFRARIGAQLGEASRLAELRETLDLGRSRIAAALAGVGVVHEAPRLAPEAIWSRYARER